MNQFFKISTENFEAISHENRYLYNQYDSIDSFIKGNFDPSYANLLAKPIFKKKEVTWFTNHDATFKRISEFNELEKEKLLQSYWFKIAPIKSKIEAFKRSQNIDKRNWAFILNEVFNDENNIIFSDGENIVLLWGWRFRNNQENFIPIENRIPLVPLPIVEPEVVEVEIIPEPIKIPSKPPKEKPILLMTPKTPWWMLFFNGLWWFFKRFWWILLLILLFLLLALLLKKCDKSPYYEKGKSQHELGRNKDNEKNGGKNGDKEYVNEDGKNYIIIDDKEIIEGKPIPIEDPDKIIVDEEEGDYEQIIPDRINIAIKRKDKDKSILELTTDLEKEYPELNIIYYSKEAKLVQIQVPAEERVRLKKEIKEKFKDLNYDLLIWDEVIFTSPTKYDKYNDPVFKDANKRWHFDAINIEDAWEITKGEEDIIIAIVDNGFDINHEDLKYNYYKPWNVYTQDSNVNVPAIKEGYGHGTHVAGISAAKINNHVGTSGIAPGCKYMPIQISDGRTKGFTSLAIIEGILYAINNGADVINLSLGKGFGEEVQAMSESAQKELINTISLDEEDFWIEIFEMANDENITIVLAAGNQDILTGIDAMARSEFTINVASVDDQLRKSDFSNYSDIYTVVSAPGGDQPGMGNDIYSCYPNNQYIEMPGTSMAAPIITGVVALMKSVNPDLTNKEIKDILQTTGKVVDASIGPLVQVDKAIKMANGNESNDDSLNEDNENSSISIIQQKIDKLREEIENLKNDCPDCD
jgi:subtilisin family serine protease